MIYYTGDIHGGKYEIVRFTKRMNLTADDVIVIEAFLPMIDQSTVDTSTEVWLDKIEESTDYGAWLCGHWHINKRIDKLQFMYHDFICSDDLKRRVQ